MTKRNVSMSWEEMEQIIHLQHERIAKLESEAYIKELVIQSYQRTAQEKEKAPEEEGA